MSPVNTDELELALMLARQRVLKIQTKLHRWARDDPYRRFDDLFNLVADPAFLLVAWDRVSGNKGAATAGVDRRTASSIVATQGVEAFLDELRSSVKDRSFHPLPVRERMIPKTGGVAPVGDSDGGGIVPRRPVMIWVSLSSLIRSTH
jgi:RNA-directed DNA polymerase